MSFNKFNNHAKIVSNLKNVEQDQLGRMTIEQVRQNMNYAKKGFQEHTNSIIEGKKAMRQTNYGATKDFTKAIDLQKQIVRSFNNK